MLRTAPVYPLLGLLMVIYVSACKPAESSTKITAIDSILVANEDYAVYSAYLNSFSLYKKGSSPDKVIITDSTTMRAGDIHPETSWNWVITHLGDHCKFDKDTIRCRKAKDPEWRQLFGKIKHPASSREKFLLPAKFKLEYPLQLLSQFHRQPIETRWETDSSSFMIFGLSKIAFTADRKKALFFGSYICGGLCGRGELIMLEKVQADWQIIDTFRFWIA